MIRWVLLIFISLFLWGLASPATAGIYRYEDENGVIHFTNCPRDPKFKLFIRESNEDVGTAPGEQERPNSNGYARDTNLYDHLISEFCQKYSVDFALIKAMIRAESGFNPYAVSRKGAKGLMQLMPDTAQRMNVTNVFSPKDNIEGGVRYFRYLLSLFDNDLRLSLAAYNAGENLVGQLKSIPPYRETVDYVQKVLAFYQSYRR